MIMWKSNRLRTEWNSSTSISLERAHSGDRNQPEKQKYCSVAVCTMRSKLDSKLTLLKVVENQALYARTVCTRPRYTCIQQKEKCFGNVQLIFPSFSTAFTIHLHKTKAQKLHELYRLLFCWNNNDDYWLVHPFKT